MRRQVLCAGAVVRALGALVGARWGCPPVAARVRCCLLGCACASWVDRGASLDCGVCSSGVVSGRRLFMRRRGGSCVWCSRGCPLGVPVAAVWVFGLPFGGVWCLWGSLCVRVGVSELPLVVVGLSLGVPVTAFGWLRDPLWCIWDGFWVAGVSLGNLCFQQPADHTPGDLPWVGGLIVLKTYCIELLAYKISQ